MFYFIPSWGSSQRKFYTRKVPWYWTERKIDFDDTIHQIQIFEQEKQDDEILLLNYAPLFRYFLHQQEFLKVPYWSVFDEIQGFEDDYPHPIDFMDFDWPEDAEFLYTPFFIQIFRGGKPYARIDFAEDGNLFSISFVAEGKSTEDHYFDDRGFLSSIRYYDENGFEKYQEYLNNQGVWQIREFLGNYGQSIEVNPEAHYAFKQAHYENMAMIIEELLEHYLQTVDEENSTIIVAADPVINPIVKNAVHQKSLVFSFFNNRQDLSNEENLRQEFLNNEKTKLLVVDNEIVGQEMKQKLTGSSIPIVQISPYDTRAQLGLSQRISKLNIALFIDDLDPQLLENVLLNLVYELSDNENIDLKLCTFKRGISKQLEDLVDKYNESLEDEVNEDEFRVLDERQLAMQALADEKAIPRIEVLSFLSGAEILKTLSYARLIIDLNVVPNLYVQILGISTGIPQINIVETSYVEHKKNGYIAKDFPDVLEGIYYYLEGLKHWNEALVYSARKIIENSGEQILKQWKELLGEDGSNSKDEGSTNRNRKLGQKI